jgi:hypothetical protein
VKIVQQSKKAVALLAEEGRIKRFIDTLTKPFKRRETPTPTMPLWKSGIQEPVLVQGITIPALFATVQESVILRTTINTLIQEIFRRGLYWEKKFQYKCEGCDTEYQYKLEEGTGCPTCGSNEIREPDGDENVYPKWLFDQRNEQDQSFLDVLREIEYDLDIIDDAFVVVHKEYYIDEETGDIEFTRVKQISRGDPVFMRIVADKRGVRGGRYKICPVHRTRTYTYSDENNDECETCNLPLQDVHYVNTAGAGKTQYYLEGEVLHISKFSPTKLYGRSPVATMWRQALTISAMDNYMYLMYSKRRVPRGILAITTDNIQSTASFWKGVEEKMERDPHYVPKVGVESQSGRGRVEWVKFMDTMDEMQYVAVREELRQRIAAFYGVSNVFMMDTGKGGGLSNEGMQILVTNRAVEKGQKLYTTDLFPRLLKIMGVNDWKLTLYPNEEEDEVTRLRRDEMEVNIAQRMMQLGFKPELVEEGERDIRFTYRKPPPPDPAQQQPPPGGGGAPPPAPPPGGGMPMAGGMPMGGMPMGGMPMRPGMHPGMPMGGQPGMAIANPAMMPQGGAPILRSDVDIGGGGSDSDKTDGSRPNRISGVKDTRTNTGSPKGTTHQRGHDKTPIEQALDSIHSAKESASDPLGDKNKDSGLYGR